MKFTYRPIFSSIRIDYTKKNKNRSRHFVGVRSQLLWHKISQWEMNRDDRAYYKNPIGKNCSKLSLLGAL